MKPEDFALAKRFPLLLGEMLSPSERLDDSALRRYGLECGPGWRPLLEALFEKLEAEIAAQPNGDRHQYRAVQIKEKFGGLRVYLDEAATPTMRHAIETAQDAAITTCDVCSMPGTHRNTDVGPIATRCESHVLTRNAW